MAKKKAATAEGSGGSKKKLVIIVVVVLGGLFAAKSMGLVGAAKPAAGAETQVTGGPTTTVPPGPVVALESITLNTADGHYLKLGLALQLDAAHAGGGGHEAATDPKAEWARALDLAIEVMGGRTYPDLVSPPGRAAAKDALQKRMLEIYPEEVVGVYLTEFVLQ